MRSLAVAELFIVGASSQRLEKRNDFIPDIPPQYNGNLSSGVRYLSRFGNLTCLCRPLSSSLFSFLFLSSLYVWEYITGRQDTCLLFYVVDGSLHNTLPHPPHQKHLQHRKLNRNRTPDPEEYGVQNHEHMVYPVTVSKQQKES